MCDKLQSEGNCLILACLSLLVYAVCVKRMSSIRMCDREQGEANGF